jgi:anti-sigma regulatory factor (Ser/Thr protein kinase)
LCHWRGGDDVLTPIHDASQVGHARRTAAQLARAAGCGDEQISRATLVATELATNLVKHAGGGSLAIHYFADCDGRGVELMALDNGPGIADIDRCLADGYSTAGSPGTGLGAIARNSSRFAIFSRPGLGSAIMARVAFEPDPHPPKTELGVVMDPYPGEAVSGDDWSFAASTAGRSLLVVDGAGHGPEANHAAKVAIELFRERANDECVRLAERMHQALMPTRGAAVGIARIDAAAKVVRFVGVGNIAAALVNAGTVRRMVSHNGTAGYIAPRIREFTYPFVGSPLLVLHSDGLTTKWDLGTYPGLAAQHPSLIAGVLFRDHRRGRDDALVVAMRVP